MEQSGNQEVKIVHWKLKNNNWSVASFMDVHSDYKEVDKVFGFDYWQTIFTLADQLGFDEVMMHKFFEEKPKYQLVDLVFAMYLVRLYGTQAWDEFFGYKKMINQGAVHGFIKSHEGLLQDIDFLQEKKEKGNQDTISEIPDSDTGDVSEPDIQECLKGLKQLLDQHETAKKEYEKAVERLYTISEKVEKQLPEKKAPDNEVIAERFKMNSAEDAVNLKRVLKLEKENAVLKTQLDAEKREANLRYDAAVEMKRMENEHLKEQMQIYLRELEKIRQENQMLKQKSISNQLRQERSGKRFFQWQRMKKSETVPMDERQKLAAKILGGDEYPNFLKMYIKKVYQEGMDLERMKMFDHPKMDLVNFEMMKSVIERTEKHA